MCYVSRVKLDFIFLALHWAKNMSSRVKKQLVNLYASNIVIVRESFFISNLLYSTCANEFMTAKKLEPLTHHY